MQRKNLATNLSVRNYDDTRSSICRSDHIFANKTQDEQRRAPLKQKSALIEWIFCINYTDMTIEQS